MALLAAPDTVKTVKNMAHEKIKAVLIFITIFSIVGGVSWALVSAQQVSSQDQLVPQFDLQAHIRDTVLASVAGQHPETAPLMPTEGWTGGHVETKLLGSDTYSYQSGGWDVEIQNAVVLDPVYTVTVHYTQPSGEVGIPYNVMWEGLWQDGNITETTYTFAQ
jgi:hypothetical protein